MIHLIIYGGLGLLEVIKAFRKKQSVFLGHDEPCAEETSHWCV